MPLFNNEIHTAILDCTSTANHSCYISNKNPYNWNAKMKKTNFVDIILKILIILGAILVIYWFIQIMFGGSPTIEQFIIGLILAVMTLVVHLYYNAGKFNQFTEGTFPRFEKNIESSFNKTKEEMNVIKEDLNLIKKKLKI